MNYSVITHDTSNAGIPIDSCIAILKWLEDADHMAEWLVQEYGYDSTDVVELSTGKVIKSYS